MKTGIKIGLVFGFLLLFAAAKAQDNSLKLNPEKEKMFLPYVLILHNSGGESIEDFKKNHPEQYLKELWYFSESFYIKRDHFKEGFTLDESIIAIHRYENFRQSTQEAIVVIPGSKDVLVMLPLNQLIYKPKL